jgi:ubiquinone/menaquinone biosynthesis C-methylase UbiE
MLGANRPSSAARSYHMNQREMVTLIQGGVAQRGGVWADLGAGRGNFSWALAELLGTEATIHTIDRDARAIEAQQVRLQREPPDATIIPRRADVTRPLDLPLLDGVLLANLLHFIANQREFLRRVGAQLRPGGQLLVVEYEQHLPIPWVPHPVSFARLEHLVGPAGFADLRQVGIRRSPSSGRVLYAASARTG